MDENGFNNGEFPEDFPEIKINIIDENHYDIECGPKYGVIHMLGKPEKRQRLEDILDMSKMEYREMKPMLHTQILSEKDRALFEQWREESKARRARSMAYYGVHKKNIFRRFMSWCNRLFNKNV